MNALSPRRGGFTLVELVVAIVVFTIGMLAMAAGVSYATIQVRSSRIRTQRTAAIADVLERLHARAFDAKAFDTALVSLPSSSAITNGGVSVWYDVTQDPADPLKRVTLYTRAPQYRSGSWNNASVDTFVVELYRPNQ